VVGDLVAGWGYRHLRPRVRDAEADPGERYNRQACRFQRPQQQARRPALHGVQPDVALQEGAEVGDRNEAPQPGTARDERHQRDVGQPAGEDAGGRVPGGNMCATLLGCIGQWTNVRSRQNCARMTGRGRGGGSDQVAGEHRDHGGWIGCAALHHRDMRESLLIPYSTPRYFWWCGVGKSFSTRADGAESPPALWEASGLKHGWVVVAKSRIEDAFKRRAPYLLAHHGVR
jgi:hypothetical protein